MSDRGLTVASLVLGVALTPILGCRGNTAQQRAKPAASGKWAGKYSARVTNAGGSGDYTADVVVETRGAYYAFTWKVGQERTYTGVGIELPGFLAVGWGLEGYRVLVYEVSGKQLLGHWASAQNDGKLGTEVLEGAAVLNGNYRIVEGHDPASGSSYEGNVSIAPNGAIYRFKRTTSDGVTLEGVGIKKGQRLLVGAGPRSGAGITVYTTSGKGLNGQWAQPTSNMLGTEFLSRR